jgi:predicted patatin/cPLA2 family phospholipase
MNPFEQNMNMNFDALVLEGGSLKCAFTAGILDVLMDSDFPEFKYYYGVSSGSMAMSYLLSKQRSNFIKVTRALVENPNFISYRNSFSQQGLMNLDFLQGYVHDTYPFDEEAADRNSEGKTVCIVATDHGTGKPHYLTPSKGKWLNYMMASATLPFITKGRTKVDGKWMFDGGYSDAIPVQKAIQDGAKNILLIRTRPSGEKIDKSYVSLMAEYWNYDNDNISDLFSRGHRVYNDCVDFLNGPKPKGIDWTQIAPPNALRSDGYYLHVQDIDADYRLGLEMGLNFLSEMKK